MEWIRISKNKLKIMLSAEDARRYDLDCGAADLGDLVTKTAFREILSDVKKQVDFDTSEDKIYIQMYPSKEGGCELFVTKIGLLLNDEEKAPHITTEHSPKAPTALRPASRKQAICFDTLAPLLSLCRRLQNAARLQKSDAFRDEKGRWWLLLSVWGNTKYGFACEYGREVRRDIAELYLTEHATPICERNAVQILADL